MKSSGDDNGGDAGKRGFFLLPLPLDRRRRGPFSCSLLFRSVLTTSYLVTAATARRWLPVKPPVKKRRTFRSRSLENLPRIFFFLKIGKNKKREGYLSREIPLISPLRIDRVDTPVNSALN